MYSADYRYILGRTSTPCSVTQSNRHGLRPFGVKKNNRDISQKLTQVTLYLLKITCQKHLCSQVISSAQSSQNALKILRIWWTKGDVQISLLKGEEEGKAFLGWPVLQAEKMSLCLYFHDLKGVQIHFDIHDVKNKFGKAFLESSCVVLVLANISEPQQFK